MAEKIERIENGSLNARNSLEMQAKGGSGEDWGADMGGELGGGKPGQLLQMPSIVLKVFSMPRVEMRLFMEHCNKAPTNALGCVDSCTVKPGQAAFWQEFRI